MLHCFLFFDILSFFFDQNTQLQLIIYPMFRRKRQRDLLRLNTDIRPRLEENQRRSGHRLIAHLYRMLQVILPNAYDLRKHSLSIRLKEMVHTDQI